MTTVLSKTNNRINIDMLVEQTNLVTSNGQQTLGEILEAFNSGEDVRVQCKHKKNILDDVANTRISTSHDFIYMQQSTGDSLIMTPDHRVYDPVKNEWVRASDISKGTHVLSLSGEHNEVVDHHKIKNPIASRVITISLGTSDCFYANNTLVKSN